MQRMVECSRRRNAGRATAGAVGDNFSYLRTMKRNLLTMQRMHAKKSLAGPAQQ